MNIKLFDNIPADVWLAMKEPIHKQRYLYYMNKIEKGTFTSVNYMEDESKLCYSQSNVALKMGIKLYFKRSNQMGFTFDKKTKKIRMWFGSTINKMSKLDLLLIALKKEWVVNEKFEYDWLTKTLLEKILADAITNPKQACRFILSKYNRKPSPHIVKLTEELLQNKEFIKSVKISKRIKLATT